MNDSESTLVKKRGGAAGDPVRQKVRERERERERQVLLRGKRAWLLGQVPYIDNI
jgi:hypothetical protein